MKAPKTVPDLSLENEYRENGFRIICGVDEAGRGPLCGPVCAAAVVLPENCEIEGLNDSKKLSEKKREELFEIIKEKALFYGIAFASPEEIDEINILNATMLAMNRAVEQTGTAPDMLLIDGNCKKGIKYPCVTVVKGDAKSMSIAAASVLAKVSRDRLLSELDEKYPQYGLKQHKGYPTAAHIAAVRQYGANEIYRKSFLGKILNNEK